MQWSKNAYYDTEAQQKMALKNRRMGINLFQISWIMVFVCLIVVNWQTRSNALNWPPAGVEPLNPLLPTLATGGLLLSVWTTSRAVAAIAADDSRRFLVQWRWTLLLGFAFIGVMAYEWLTLAPISEQAKLLSQGFGSATPPVVLYNVLFRFMTAFHAFHALVIIAFMIYVMRRANQYSSQDYWDAEAGAKLWYFVVIAWIMFYIVLYIV